MMTENVFVYSFITINKTLCRVVQRVTRLQVTYFENDQFYGIIIVIIFGIIACKY